MKQTQTVTKKDILTIVATIAALSLLWYFVSPTLHQKEPSQTQPSVQIQDNLYGMDATTTERFNIAMQEVNDAAAKTLNDQLRDAPLVLHSRGTLSPRAFNVSGAVSLLEVGGQKILRFENLDTLNGPELRIYLASNLSDKDIVDLGPIRATKGNVNYNVPANTDTAKYRYVLVWSKSFGIMFSYAEFR